MTVSHTAGASITGILRTGAVPVLVDVTYDSMTIDPAAVEAVLRTPPSGLQVRALLAVHLYGDMADMPRLMTVASDADLVVVEDCAQAHGAVINGAARWPLGRRGRLQLLSPRRTSVRSETADSSSLVAGMSRIRRSSSANMAGDVAKFRRGPGANSRLDEVQAAVLRVGLSHLHEDNARRRAIASRYDDELSASPIRRPMLANGHQPVFHQYVVRTHQRDSLRRHCDLRGIGTAIHYPVPAHRQPRLPTRDALRGAWPSPTDSLTRSSALQCIHS